MSLVEAARIFWKWRPRTMWLTLDGGAFACAP